MKRELIKEAYKSSNIGSSIGGVTIDSDLYIVIADISFHTFLWEHTYFPITKIIHPDDIEDFKAMLCEVTEEEPQEMILLIKGNDEIYIPAFLTAKVSSRKTQGNFEYDLEFSNVITASKSIKKYNFLIKKLGEIVALCGYILFEYNVETNKFKIYYKSKGRSNIVYDGTFADFKAYALENELVEPKSRNDFEDFCNDVEKCRSNFSYSIKCSFIPGISPNETLNIKASTVSDDLNAVLVVGIISTESITSQNNNFFNDKANIDALTGILNKQAITEYAIKSVNSAKGHVAIAIMDVDYFKSINDTYGHMIGDEILSTISSVIRDSVLGKGVPGRIGGDEFFIVFDNIESENQLRIVIREMRFRIEVLCREKVPDLTVTCTLGVAQYPTDADNFETLFRIADKALYIGKLKGRNRFIIYRKSLHGELDDNPKTGLNVNVAKTPFIKRRTLLNIIDRFSENPNTPLDDIIKPIAENYNIDEIRIYTGDTPKLKYSSSGKEDYCDNGIEIFYSLESEYYDSENMLIIDNYVLFEYKEKNFFNYLDKNRILSSMTYLIRNDDKNIGLISYMMKGSLRKWSEWDINMIAIISKLLEKQIIKTL